METFEKIKELCDSKGISVLALEKELGEKQSTISKSTSNMKAEKLYKIASFFHVSMETIMCKPDIIERNPAPGEFLSSEEKRLLEYFRKLNDVGKSSIMSSIEGLLKNPDFTTSQGEKLA